MPKVAGKAEGIARTEVGASDDEDSLLMSLWLLVWTKTDAVGLALALSRLWMLVWVETDTVVVVGVLGSGWGLFLMVAVSLILNTSSFSHFLQNERTVATQSIFTSCGKSSYHLSASLPAPR